MSRSGLQKLAMVYISQAKSQLPETVFQQLDVPALQQYLMFVGECVPTEDLLDPVLIRHALDSLSSSFSAESTALHIFSLFIYKKLGLERVHPLELGILKQQVQGLMPVFKRAVDLGKIEEAYFDQYHNMLLNLVEQTDLVEDVIMLLEAEYQRFADSPE